MQKKLLVMNVKEAYQVCKEENIELSSKVGKSKFAALRPPYVALTHQKDYDVCMCQYCENLKIILEAAHKMIPNFPNLSPTAALQHTVCQLDDEHIACIDRLCITCGAQANLDSVNPATTDLSKRIQYYQWGNNEVGYTIKIMTETTIANAKDELKTQLQTYARHLFNYKKQHGEKEELIFHSDFAENKS